MCKILQIPRSTYYDKQNRPISARAKSNEDLKEQILKIYVESKQRYGSPKITKILNKELQKKGLKTVSLKRVQRLMNELNIKSIVVKKYRPYSKSSNYNEGENILDQDFTTTSINQKWVGDITYIYTRMHGWCYLASVEDLYTRKISSFAFSNLSK